jgi:hypothetical protein
LCTIHILGPSGVLYYSRSIWLKWGAGEKGMEKRSKTLGFLESVGGRKGYIELKGEKEKMFLICSLPNKKETKEEKVGEYM